MPGLYYRLWYSHRHTADDRIKQKLAEVNEWIAKHGREPRNEGDLKERMMYAAMTSLREKGFDVWI